MPGRGRRPAPRLTFRRRDLAKPGRGGGQDGGPVVCTRQADGPAEPRLTRTNGRRAGYSRLGACHPAHRRPIRGLSPAGCGATSVMSNHHHVRGQQFTGVRSRRTTPQSTRRLPSGAMASLRPRPQSRALRASLPPVMRRPLDLGAEKRGEPSGGGGSTQNVRRRMAPDPPATDGTQTSRSHVPAATAPSLVTRGTRNASCKLADQHRPVQVQENDKKRRLLGPSVTSHPLSSACAGVVLAHRTAAATFEFGWMGATRQANADSPAHLAAVSVSVTAAPRSAPPWR